MSGGGLKGLLNWMTFMPIQFSSQYSLIDVCFLAFNRTIDWIKIVNIAIYKILTCVLLDILSICSFVIQLKNTGWIAAMFFLQKGHFPFPWWIWRAHLPHWPAWPQGTNAQNSLIGSMQIPQSWREAEAPSLAPSCIVPVPSFLVCSSFLTFRAFRGSVTEQVWNFLYVQPIFIDEKVFGAMNQNFKALS